MEVAQLTAASGGETMRFEVRAGEPATLGRSSKCTVKLRDPKVSRVHCQLALANGRLQVTDLDSSQGLLHRGLPQKQFELDLGDGFHLGTTFVRFESCATNAPTSQRVEPPPRPELPRAAPTAAAAPDRPRTPALAPGTVLGRFTVGTVLGRGRRCTTYRAQQAGLGRPVAVKVFDIAADAADGERSRAAFVADVQHTAAHPDPFLVPVLDCGEVDGTCFAALELVRGSSVAQAVGDGRRLPWTKLVPALADAAQALAARHAQGLGHGAVTPGNVFVRDAGGGLLADPRHDAAFAPADDLRGLAAVAHLALTGEEAPARAQRVPSLRGVDGSLPPHVDRLLCELLAPDAQLPAATAAGVHAQLTAAPVVGAAAPVAPTTPAPAAAPRAPVFAYPDVEPERARPIGKAPAGKVFAAKLVAQLIVFSITFVIAIVVLVALKKAGFDLYAMFGV